MREPPGIATLLSGAYRLALVFITLSLALAGAVSVVSLLGLQPSSLRFQRGLSALQLTHTGMLEQQTALHVFVLTGEPDVLATAASGRGKLTAGLRGVSTVVRTDPWLRPSSAPMLAAISRWETGWAAVARRPAPGRSAAARRDLAGTGSDLFARYQRTEVGLQAALARGQREASDRQRRLTTLWLGLEGLLVPAAFLVAARQRRLLQRLIAEPAAQLGGSMGRVGQGRPPEPPTTGVRELLHLGAALTSMDVSLTAEKVALRQAEAELLAQHEFTEAVVQSAGSLVFVTDREGRLERVNRAYETTLGAAAADVVGLPFWDVLVPPEERTVKRAEVLSRTAADYPAEGESDWFTATGTRRRVAWTSTVLLDEAGGIAHMICTGLDVTNHRATQSMMADVLGAVTEQAIVATDAAGLVLVFNAGAEALLGYRDGEVVRRRTVELFHDPAELLSRSAQLGVTPGIEAVLAGARSGGAETREWTYVRRSGERVPVSLSVTPMMNPDGTVRGFIHVAYDVGERRKTAAALGQALLHETAAVARLQELDAAKTLFVSSMSHELRTPLTSVVGYVELLTDGDAGELAPPQQEVLAVVARNAQRLLALVEDLLILSQIDSGTFRIRPRPTAVCGLVHGAVEDLESLIGSRRTRVTLDLPVPLAEVAADPDQVQRVLARLLGNAVKFTAPGGAVAVRAVPDGDAVWLEVADTGIGIPEQEQGHLFERFFRSSLAQSEAVQGSGLGLSICRSVVEQHGGRIVVTSEPGLGTTVAFSLPVAPTVPGRPVRPDEPALAVGPVASLSGPAASL